MWVMREDCSTREDAEDQRGLLGLPGGFVLLMMNDGGVNKVGCGR